MSPASITTATDSGTYSGVCGWRVLCAGAVSLAKLQSCETSCETRTRRNKPQLAMRQG